MERSLADLGSIINSQPPSGASLADLTSRNAPYVRPNTINFETQLPPIDELSFRSWVAQNKVPFNPNDMASDYDMRGFWNALQRGDPRAKSAVNANDAQMHYPDFWKTPAHESFSQESKFAGPMAPRWNDQDQLIAPSQRILFDERRR